MRTITRVLAAGTLSLPLALGVAGIASADTEEINVGPVQLAAQSEDERGDRSAALNLTFDNEGRDDRDGLEGLFDGTLSTEASGSSEGDNAGSVQLGAQSQDERGNRAATLDLTFDNEGQDNQDRGILNNVL